jgi:lactoylglutathione lyase
MIGLLAAVQPPGAQARARRMGAASRLTRHHHVLMSNTRPFKVLGIQQVAIGGPSKERLRSLWVDKLGLEVVGNFVSQQENVDEDICALGQGPFSVELDLMQPLDPLKKPAVHRPALNHIGLWIDDLPAAVAWLSASGVRFAPGGIRKGAAGHDICFVHPKSNDEFPVAGEGVLIELVQAPPEIVAAHGHVPPTHRR